MFYLHIANIDQFLKLVLQNKKQKLLSHSYIIYICNGEDGLLAMSEDIEEIYIFIHLFFNSSFKFQEN